jgi:hypothetical protein
VWFSILTKLKRVRGAINRTVAFFSFFCEGNNQFNEDCKTPGFRRVLGHYIAIQYSYILPYKEGKG